MGKESEALDVQLIARGAKANGAADEALTWYTPVRFDAALLKKLLDGHDALDARIASLTNRFRHDREDAWRLTHACAGQLHELRRQEALWIYPVIAHGLTTDAAARRRLLNLRFLMNSLARRVLRSIEELARRIGEAAEIGAHVSIVTRALAEYRLRNETELYTLYSLMDPRRMRAVALTEARAK